MKPSPVQGKITSETPAPALTDPGRGPTVKEWNVTNDTQHPHAGDVCLPTCPAYRSPAMEIQAMSRTDVPEHSFEGRYDRWCTYPGCDRPDRNPIHGAAAEHDYSVLPHVNGGRHLCPACLTPDPPEEMPCWPGDSRPHGPHGWPLFGRTLNCPGVSLTQGQPRRGRCVEHALTYCEPCGLTSGLPTGQSKETPVSEYQSWTSSVVEFTPFPAYPIDTEQADVLISLFFDDDALPETPSITGGEEEHPFTFSIGADLMLLPEWEDTCRRKLETVGAQGIMRGWRETTLGTF